MNPIQIIRQKDIIPSNVLMESITIIGAGAIGSFTCLSLAKMGFENITVFDFDNIEEENMNCQFYRQGDIGKNKVDALKEQIKDFTGVNILAFNDRYRGGDFQGIVISAVDNMYTRRLIWESQGKNTRMVIDPRMGAENGLLYTMDPKVKRDRISYEKTLYSDDQALHEPCTAKSTTYCALLLSGLVAKTVKDIVTGNPYCRTAIWSVKENKFTSWVVKS